MATDGRKAFWLALGDSFRPLVSTTALAAIVTAFLCSMLFPLVSIAGEPYIGAAGGYSIAHFNNTDLLQTGTYYPLVSRVGGASYRLFAGYSFSPYIALEGGWFDATHLSGTVAGFPINSSQSFVGGPNKARIHGVSLDAVGTVPLNEHLSGFVRAGVLASKITNNTWYPVLTYFANPPPPDLLIVIFPTPDHATLFEFGVGVQYKIDSRWSLKSDWQRVNTSVYRLGNLDTFEIGAVYTF